MSTILEMYEPQQKINESMNSDVSLNFMKIIMLQEELEMEKENLFKRLTFEEKKEIFQFLSKRFNIPELITVRDVADILELSPQMVRRHCADGKIKSLQTLEGSGKWRVYSDQFMDHPNWFKFIKKRKKIKNQSIDIAEKMLDLLDDIE